ncbi:MAG: polysaccharide biosynthesis protein [Phycisphaerae bacterium]|nr:polysaccharide biosynthesis protein [Phycisphaerae bacterium]
MTDSTREEALSDHRRRGWRRRWPPFKPLALSFLIYQVLFTASYLLSYGVAYNFHFGEPAFLRYLLPLMPCNIAIKATVFGLFRLYRGWWRYVGLRDLVSVFWASYVSWLAFLIFYFAIDYMDVLPRDVPIRPQLVFVLDWGLTIALVCSARAAVRLYREEFRPVASGGPVQLLIVGAGDAGEMILREILRMPVERYRVVGFLDDAPALRRARIHGVDVLGTTDQVGEVCAARGVDEVLIALPEADQRQLRKVVEASRGAAVRFRMVPGPDELIRGDLTLSQLREVRISDLLGREEVALDVETIEHYIRSKRVLVTGAGGSIGSELCRQILKFTPRRLVLIEQAENNLFEVDRELREAHPDADVQAYIADVCDEARLRQIFDVESPDVVFHAAAHKHVPLMEENPGEAAKNNILGTKYLADTALAHGCRKFVLISTDKAVNPSSVMGCTKRVAEMYIQQLSPDGPTQFVTVRFGNVLGSSGSVVPVFQRQIAAGGPVTVTHPDMVRYFMTIPEATQLTLQAGAIGRGGEIFLLDMGEPVKIVDLARELITLSGLRPDEDIEIRYTGIRPGEKLFEELNIRGEDVAPTPHAKIGIWRHRAEDHATVCRAIEDLVQLACSGDAKAIRVRLAEIVPEYAGPDPGASNVPPPSD